MNDFDKHLINERLDLAIKVVESYNRDISSFVSGDLYAYISDNLDGVDVASVENYLKRRYISQDELIIDFQNALENADDEDEEEYIKTLERLDCMDSANIYDYPMVDFVTLDYCQEVKQVTTHDIIKYLEECKY